MNLFEQITSGTYAKYKELQMHVPTNQATPIRHNLCYIGSQNDFYPYERLSLLNWYFEN